MLNILVLDPRVLHSYTYLIWFLICAFKHHVSVSNPDGAVVLGQYDRLCDQ